MRPHRDLLELFGQNVRRRRNAKSWTQERLAAETDFDRTYISLLERGARNPSLVNIARLATGLGTTASELLKGV